MRDYVYYLYVNGKIESDLIFSSEQGARDFAEASGKQDYDVVKWDVD